MRIVVADGHPLMRLAIRRVLESEEDVRIVGEAADADELLEEIERTRADLVVLDLRVPGARGLDCLRRVKARHPEVKVVLVSAEQSQPTIDEARLHGADGFVTKTVEATELVDAIRMAFEGVVFPVAMGVDEAVGIAADLTGREREILELLSRGLSNNSIAGELWVTEQTVKFHLTNIYRKLGVSNRTQAAAWAVGWQRGRTPTI